MAAKDAEFSDFVEHPRYGRVPRYTNLKLPAQPAMGNLLTHWNSPPPWAVPGTAVKADISRQRGDVYGIEYYVDTRKICCECNRPFLFFAEEQKYWYEELGFGLPAQCVHCPECRKRRHGLWWERKRYQELHGSLSRTSFETLEMVACCLRLVEAGEFDARQLAHARALLKHIPKAERDSDQFRELAGRAGFKFDAGDPESAPPRYD